MMETPASGQVRENEGPQINIGVLLSLSPQAPVDALQDFARRLIQDVLPELKAAGRAQWSFHYEEPARLAGDAPHRPADFLDEASLRMVEGPFDVVLVITDVPLVSRTNQVVAGLASEISQVAVLSTRKLLTTPRGEPLRTLDSKAARWNSAALMLHLLGHLLGLRHSRGAADAMAPYRFRENLRALPNFDHRCRAAVQRRVDRLPEREAAGGGALSVLAFHIGSALRNLGQVVRPLLRNRALLLPLSLPSLATAAVAPTFILIFTAEIWDVGLNMSDAVSWTFALLSILAATWYLVKVQNLFFPHQEKSVVTEHMAVVNVTILLTMLLAMIGLFVMVGALMLAVAIYIFPPDLISTWPTLQDPQVDYLDKIRLASFISTVGVLTGALAGGLESRTVIRHLALFEDEP